MKAILIILGLGAAFALGLYFHDLFPNNAVAKNTKSDVDNEEESTNTTSNLGAFSLSLSVKDLAASKKFYEDLGFATNGGGDKMNYHIMKNGNALVGIFQGMFEGNILTFNPGWDENAKNIESFTDIREIRNQLISCGHEIAITPEEKPEGPANFMITDPDGNLIMLDQHR